MNSSCEPSPETRRARPLLGTFVDIRVGGLRPRRAVVAVERGFDAIARVHSLMSRYDSRSDVSRLNRAPLRQPVSVDPWTWRVLAAACWLAEKSDGLFDPTVGRDVPHGGDWRALQMLDRSRVMLRRRVRLDLGGIAKGFAVDRAVGAMRAAGAPAGVVNAGGDLRAFGSIPAPVYVRDPFDPARLVPVGTLRDEALATSANYLDPLGRGRLQRPDGRRLWIGRGSVSVRAPCCLLADALCKVVAADGPRRSATLLEACGAVAHGLTRRGPRAQPTLRHAA